MINDTNMIDALTRRNKSGVARHLAEKQLAPNPSDLIAELAVASVQGIIVLGERNIEFCNERARELNGVPASVLSAGKPWMAFFQYQMDRGDFGKGDVAEKFFKDLLDNFQSRQVMQVERQAGDGRIIRADRIPNSVGGMTLTLTDISELKAREAELEAISVAAQTAEKAKSDFLANMSHELRTPLNGILGMAEVLGTSDLPPDQKEAADVILTSAEALVSVVDDVLEVSRLDLGHVSLDQREFDVARLMRDLVAEYAAAAANKGLDLRLRLPEVDVPPLVTDCRLLRQVVSHVLDNAIRFTEAGRVVVMLDVGAETEAGVAVSMSVRDTGVGIAEPDLEKIFERFTQADSSISRAYDGSGLGLSLAKAYTDLLGGEIVVESVLGEGSCFTVSLRMSLSNQRGDAGE